MVVKRDLFFIQCATLPLHQPVRAIIPHLHLSAICHVKCWRVVHDSLCDRCCAMVSGSRVMSFRVHVGERSRGSLYPYFGCPTPRLCAVAPSSLMPSLSGAWTSFAIGRRIVWNAAKSLKPSRRVVHDTAARHSTLDNARRVLTFGTLLFFPLRRRRCDLFSPVGGAVRMVR
jgi:hypothetical protein